MQIFAIRDRALGAYMQPWVAQTPGQATRMFQDELGSNESPMNKHPDDYDLYHIGEFNQDTGVLIPKESAQLLASGKNLKQA